MVFVPMNTRWDGAKRMCISTASHSMSDRVGNAIRTIRNFFLSNRKSLPVDMFCNGEKFS